MCTSQHNMEKRGCFLMLRYSVPHGADIEVTNVTRGKRWRRPESKAPPEGLSYAGTDVSGFLRELSKCGLIYGLSQTFPAFSLETTVAEVPACRRWCCRVRAGSGRQGKWWRRTDSVAAGGFAVRGCRSTPAHERRQSSNVLVTVMAYSDVSGKKAVVDSRIF